MLLITRMFRQMVIVAALFTSFVVFASERRDSVDWVADGVFTAGIEGPVVDHNGNLYAVNYQRQGTIGIVKRDASSNLLIELPNDSIGNGLRFNSLGHLLIADYVNHNILKLNMETMSLEVFAHQPAMNQPNDLAISGKDIIYASDPNWQNSTGQLWMVDVRGKSYLIESQMGTTNGVEVSVDEHFLYVNESVQRNVWRYELDKRGKPGNKVLFHHFADHGLDGMRSDAKGNLYIARYGAGVIAVLNPNGELVREYQLKGQHPTNVAFGGCDGQTLYVTMQKRGAIEKLRVDHPGRSFNLANKATKCSGDD